MKPKITRPCRHCGALISPDAARCEHCKVRNPFSGGRAGHLLPWMLSVLLLAGFVVFTSFYG